MFKLLGSIAVFILGVVLAGYSYYSSLESCSVNFSLETYQCVQRLTIILGLFSIAIILTGVVLTVVNFNELRGKASRRK